MNQAYDILNAHELCADHNWEVCSWGRLRHLQIWFTQHFQWATQCLQPTGNPEPLKTKSKTSNVTSKYRETLNPSVCECVRMYMRVYVMYDPIHVWWAKKKGGRGVVNISTGLFLDQCFQVSFWRTNFMIYSDTKQSAMFARQWQRMQLYSSSLWEKDDGTLQRTRLVDERNGQHRQKASP
jgi:hypothetical protein